MAARRITLADVAQAAGVSVTTASFVLNRRHAGIPADTQGRVRSAARQLGYRPHAAARALATGRTHRIGIVLNQPESFGAGDTYFGEVLAGITECALRHNYNLLLHAAHYPDWRDLCADILGGSSDGVLLVGRFASDELTPALLDSGFPTTCLSYEIPHPGCVSVDCRNEEGGYLAARHLLELGHRHLALFYPGYELSWGEERRRGVQCALSEAGVPAANLQAFAWPGDGAPSPAWVNKAIQFLKEASPRPTGVICCDELRSRMLAESLPGAGIRIPADCSVVSFNSTEVSKRAHPPLTSIWQPLREIGSRGVDVLIDHIEGRDSGESQCRLPVRLDARQSCHAPVAGAAV